MKTKNTQWLDEIHPEFLANIYDEIVFQEKQKAKDKFDEEAPKAKIFEAKDLMALLMVT